MRNRNSLKQITGKAGLLFVAAAVAASTTATAATARPQTVPAHAGSRGAGCALQLSAQRSELPYFGGTGTFSYTVADSCFVTAASTDEWLTVTQDGQTVAVEPAGSAPEGRKGTVGVTATNFDTGKTEWKNHTVVQQKRAGAGSATLGREVTVDSAGKAADATGAVKELATTISRTGTAIGTIINAMPDPERDDETCEADPLANLMRQVKTALQEGKRRATFACPDGGSINVSKNEGVTLDFALCRITEPVPRQLNGRIAVKHRHTRRDGTFRGDVTAGTKSAPFTETIFTNATFAAPDEQTDFRLTLDVDHLQGDDVFDAAITGTVDRTISATEDRSASWLGLDLKGLKISYLRSGTSATISASGRIRAAIAPAKNLAGDEFLLKQVTITAADGAALQTAQVNGTFAINSHPAGSCSDGTFTVSTHSPLRFDDSGRLSQGHLILNGTAATIAPNGIISLDATPEETANTATTACRM